MAKKLDSGFFKELGKLLTMHMADGSCAALIFKFREIVVSSE